MIFQGFGLSAGGPSGSSPEADLRRIGGGETKISVEHEEKIIDQESFLKTRFFIILDRYLPEKPEKKSP